MCGYIFLLVEGGLFFLGGGMRSENYVKFAIPVSSPIKD